MNPYNNMNTKLFRVLIIQLLFVFHLLTTSVCFMAVCYVNIKSISQISYI